MIARISAKSSHFIRNTTKHRFIRYAIVGVFSAALELGILISLVEVFKMTYLRANVIAFSIVVIVNYILSRKWVFQSKENKKRIEFPVFMFFVGCGFLINQATLWYFVSQVGIHYEIAKIIAIGLVVIWNFFTRKFFIFKKILPSAEEREF